MCKSSGVSLRCQAPIWRHVGMRGPYQNLGLTWKNGEETPRSTVAGRACLGAFRAGIRALMPAPKPSPNPSQPLVQAEAAGRCRPAALQLGLPAPVKRPRVPSIFTKQPIEVRHECASVHQPFYSSARFFWPPSLFCSRGEHRGHFSASASAARRSRQMGGGSAGARQLPKTQHSHLSRAPLRAESLAPLHRCVLQL